MNDRPRRTAGAAEVLSGPAVPFAQWLAACARQRLRDRAGLVRRCRKKSSEKTVHRLRVETRRLMAQLELLAPLLPVEVREHGRRALRKQMKALATLRDLHVQLRQVKALRAEYPELKPFQAYLRTCERAAARVVLRKLDRKKHQRRIAAVHAQLLGVETRREESDRRFADKVLRTLEKALRQLIRLQEHAGRDVDSLHPLRVALKTYRYMVESLQPVLPAATAGQFDRMREWQAWMGEIHDLTLLEERIDRFAVRTRADRRYEKVRDALAQRRMGLDRAHCRLTPVQLRALLPRPSESISERRRRNRITK